jgi:hypothetical protein
MLMTNSFLFEAEHYRLLLHPEVNSTVGDLLKTLPFFSLAVSYQNIDLPGTRITITEHRLARGITAKELEISLQIDVVGSFLPIAVCLASLFHTIIVHIGTTYCSEPTTTHTKVALAGSVGPGRFKPTQSATQTCDTPSTCDFSIGQSTATTIIHWRFRQCTTCRR